MSYPGEARAAEVPEKPTEAEQLVSAKAETQVQTSEISVNESANKSQQRLRIFILFVLTCFLCGDLQPSTEKQSPVKTVGPLTDADVVKLRPCEKKQVHLS